ncbi:MAG TPA: hypothetical protein VIR38_01340, partial [Thalassobaculum sp.]
GARPAALSDDAVREALASIGYRTVAAGSGHPANRAALSAFRRHWCPDTLGRPFDPAVAGMLRAVADATEKTRKSRCTQGR